MYLDVFSSRYQITDNITKGLLLATPCGEHVTCISPSNPEKNSATGTQLGSDRTPQEDPQETHRGPPSCVSLLCCVWLFLIPGTVAHEAHLSMEILQARILEWVAMSSSGGSSQPSYRIWSPALQWILYHLSHQGSPWILERVADPFLQGIFPTQESNHGLLPCRQILDTQPVIGGFSDVDQAVWFQSAYMRVPNQSPGFLQ